MSVNIEAKCDLVLNKIRNSGLNFSCQETPYSLFVTLRKSLITPRLPQHFLHHKQHDHNQVSEVQHDDIKEKYENLLLRHQNLEHSYDRLQNDLENAIEEAATEDKVIKHLRHVVEEKSATMEILDTKAKNLEDDKRDLVTEVDRLVSVNKGLEKSLAEFKSKNIALKSDLKSLKKEKQEAASEFDLKWEALKRENENLSNTKIKQATEVQNLKTDIKNLKKKLKLVEGEIVELEIQNVDLANEAKTVVIETEVKDCQTDSHPEIPYDVTAPLPPIFSLQLCHTTPPINFLSRSLPRLDKIRWCQPNEYMVDDAEEYLNYQYEQEIKEFYRGAKNKAREQKYDDAEDNLGVKCVDENKNMID